MNLRQPAYSLFPTEEYIARVDKARRLMDKQGMDALVLSERENVIYFSGIRTIGWDSKHRPIGLIIPRSPDKPVTSVMPESLFEVSFNSSWIDNVQPWGGWQRKDAIPDPIVAIHNVCQSLGVDSGKIGLELGYGQRVGMSQEDFGALQAGLPRATFVDAGPLIWELRMIKSLREVEALRKACDATSKAFERGFESATPKMTERELAGVIFSEVARQTNEKPGFVMIRSGPSKYGMINVEPFEKPMNPGELVVVDIGANYKYYWSDFMRMASIGNPSPDQRRIFDGELAAQQAGVDVIKPGIQLHEIFDACYQTLVDRGLKGHVPGMERVGHGVGLDVHEPPSIARGSQVIVQPGMILTVEPIFWDRPNHQIGNFALEDMVLVTETGHEVLSAFPKDLFIVK